MNKTLPTLVLYGAPFTSDQIEYICKFDPDIKTNPFPSYIKMNIDNDKTLQEISGRKFSNVVWVGLARAVAKDKFMQSLDKIICC